MVHIKETTFELFDLSEDKPGFFAVDELLAFSIQMLNQKGYKTHFCCEGHFFDVDEFRRLHIRFHDEVDFEDLPEGFIFSECALIYKYSDFETVYEFTHEKAEICQRLNAWVESLPNNPLPTK